MNSGLQVKYVKNFTDVKKKFFEYVFSIEFRFGELRASDYLAI